MEKELIELLDEIVETREGYEFKTVTIYEKFKKAIEKSKEMLEKYRNCLSRRDGLGNRPNGDEECDHYFAYDYQNWKGMRCVRCGKIREVK